MMKCAKLLYCLLTIVLLTFTVQQAYSASITSQTKNTAALSTLAPAEQSLRVAQMKMFTNLTITQYEKLSGKKLNFFGRLSFRMSQNRMKKMLKRYDYGEVSTLQKISWLLKGLLLGPIAVLLAYIFLHDEEAELIKWTWFGFAGWAIIVGIILLTL
jgi:hypothetical protein